MKLAMLAIGLLLLEGLSSACLARPQCPPHNREASVNPNPCDTGPRSIFDFGPDTDKGQSQKTQAPLIMFPAPKADAPAWKPFGQKQSSEQKYMSY